jgi:hypothetical protein
MFSIDMCVALPEAEEGQHRQDHDNQTDKIDKTVHGFLHMSRAILNSTIVRNRQSSRNRQEKVATGNSGSTGSSH